MQSYTVAAVAAYMVMVGVSAFGRASLGQRVTVPVVMRDAALSLLVAVAAIVLARITS